MIKINITLTRTNTAAPWLYETTLPWFLTWENYLQSTYIDTGKLEQTPKIQSADRLTTTFTATFKDLVSYKEYKTDATQIDFVSKRDQYYQENGIIAEYERVL